MRIGIDVGGVVIGGPGKDTQFFSEDFLITSPVPGALDSITLLAQEHEIFFISKAYPNTALKTRRWFNFHGAFCNMNVDPDRLIFCRERSEKAPIALLLELDVFIDDRRDIVQSMQHEGVDTILFTDWKSTTNQLGTIKEKICPSSE